MLVGASSVQVTTAKYISLVMLAPHGYMQVQHLRLREVFQLRRGREWHRTVRLAGDQPVYWKL